MPDKLTEVLTQTVEGSVIGAATGAFMTTPQKVLRVMV